MKIHLLYGNRIACDCNLPQGATFAVNTKLITCNRCRKTKVFQVVESQQSLIPRNRKDKSMIQEELFKQENE